MRIRWDEAKRRRVLAEREIDFGQLNDLLYSPYLEDQRSEIPEQYRIIGFSNGKLTTFIVEYRVDTAVFPRMRYSAKPGNPSKSSIRQIKLYSVAVCSAG